MIIFSGLSFACQIFMKTMKEEEIVSQMIEISQGENVDYFITDSKTNSNKSLPH